MLLAEGYGALNHRREAVLDAHSSMRLASVSKQFTAAAVLRVVEDGGLDLDHCVSRYIEGFPYADVTVRHLLNQTSGIMDVYVDLAQAREAEIEVLTNARVAELINEAAPKLADEPGDAFLYSNTNYVLLAFIVETVSGLSLEAFLERELFKPLGMHDSRIWNLVSEDEPGPRMSLGMNVYNQTPGKGEAVPTFIDGVSGDGAVHSSAHDMAIWNRFWIDGGGLISPTRSPSSCSQGHVSGRCQAIEGCAQSFTRYSSSTLVDSPARRVAEKGRIVDA